MTTMNESSGPFRDDPWSDMNIGLYPRSARRLYQNDDRFWVSIDEHGRRLFFVEENGAYEQSRLEKVAFVEIHHYQPKQGVTRACCVLEDTNLLDMFTIVAKDVAYRCSDYTGQKLFKNFYARIEAWGNFLKPARSGIGFKRLMGFFSELYVLKTLFADWLPAEQAIQAWGGPSGNNQDFLYNGVSVEVKSTLYGEKKVVTISSEHQLDSDGEQCFLLHISLSLGNTFNSLTLRDLVTEIELTLTEDAQALSDFRVKVAQDFGQASRIELDTPFLIRELNIYNVDNHFPKLTPKHIQYSEISGVKYRLNLTGLGIWGEFIELREVLRNGDK
ncbi:PD-(D/E)XK motif protein [Pseudidiomarina sp. GXY010]|uniref:PD-(D/E)XK motif protein n=1 Tax=Pseudidiomarina fusca TaxID=2965078 RepID=A0ABU3L0K8_9GAMM|nr:PD-(D/E)XK motif protein [Pseudidiomarina sp. GXY010]MDT7526723.1 PD-(D/E)XK motif protein [Pseudidiomarina sp. GXY010]